VNNVVSATVDHGKALYELQQWSAAKSHLEQDVKQWGHSESWLLLAKIDLNTDGDRVASKNYLTTMLARLKASPKYNYRKQLHLIRSAEKMLKTL
jgi:hypothetical protein